MGMKQTLEIVNRTEADGIIGRYAIAGAVAAFNYVAPSLSDDLDILVSFVSTPEERKSGLVTLSPVFTYLKEKGYSEFRNEGLLIEGWPVQFLPVANELDDEALQMAQEQEVELDPGEGSVRTRFLRPEHIVATALRTGRPKDRYRVIQFLEEKAVDIDALRDVVDRHGLRDKWRTFCAQAGIPDPFEVKSEP